MSSASSCGCCCGRDAGFRTLVPDEEVPTTSSSVDTGTGQDGFEQCFREYILCGDLYVCSLVEDEPVYADGECFVMCGDSLHAVHTDLSGSMSAQGAGSVDSVVDIGEHGDGLQLYFLQIYGDKSVCLSSSKSVDIVTVRGAGRSVKTHPFEFPLGFRDGQVPDLSRKGTVFTLSEWVQHALRFCDGRFVVGWRGQLLFSSMVNEFMLHQARQRGYVMPRNVKRRIGPDFQEGGAVTKRACRNSLKDEGSVCVFTKPLFLLSMSRYEIGSSGNLHHHGYIADSAQSQYLVDRLI